jgi:hypothetical protein
MKTIVTARTLTGQKLLWILTLLISSMAFALPQSWAHGANGQPCPVRGFNMRCFGNVLDLNATRLAFSQSFSVTVSPSTAFQFDLGSEIILEPTTGVGFGVGLIRLCSDRDPRGRPTCQALRSGNMITFDLSTFTESDRQLLRNKTFALLSLNFARYEHADAMDTITFVDQLTLPPLLLTTAPVINNITINRNTPVNTRVYGTINFSDPDGNVTRVDFLSVRNFTDFNFNPNVLGRRNGMINFFITCDRVGVPFSADVVLTDQALNASNIVQLDFTCVR